MFQINIDPETLKPKLPSRKDLRPYPATCYLEYKGHTGAVMSISTEASGQWIASGLFVRIFLLHIHSNIQQMKFFIGCAFHVLL